jgi:hypothetical protein
MRLDENDKIVGVAIVPAEVGEGTGEDIGMDPIPSPDPAPGNEGPET